MLVNSIWENTGYQRKEVGCFADNLLSTISFRSICSDTRDRSLYTCEGSKDWRPDPSETGCLDQTETAQMILSWRSPPRWFFLPLYGVASKATVSDSTPPWYLGCRTMSWARNSKSLLAQHVFLEPGTNQWSSFVYPRTAGFLTHDDDVSVTYHNILWSA